MLISQAAQATADSELSEEKKTSPLLPNPEETVELAGCRSSVVLSLSETSRRTTVWRWGWGVGGVGDLRSAEPLSPDPDAPSWIQLWFFYKQEERSVVILNPNQSL